MPKHTLKVPEALWKARIARMEKLCHLNAPLWIIVAEALLILKSVGLYRALWFNFKSSYLPSKQAGLQYFWYKTILRKSDEEIDKIFLSN